jgi:hypothetical protein
VYWPPQVACVHIGERYREAHNGEVIMKSVAILAILLTPMAVSAQATNSTAESCERSWLAADWPTVAVDCSTMAHADEESAKRHESDAVAGPSAMFKEAMSLIGPELYFATVARARASVAYAHLQRLPFSTADSRCRDH